jgi:hypothetical protein
MFLVVVNQFNVKGVSSFKTENDAPVGSDGHGPQSLQISFERVQAIARNIQSLWSSRAIEIREDSFDSLQQIGPYPAAVAAFIEPFEATMIEAPNHQDTP